MVTGHKNLSDVTTRGTLVPRVPVFVFAVLLSLGAYAPADAARTWTSSGGNFTIEAEFVDYNSGQNGGTVRLRKTDGKEIDVPLDKLSALDRNWVANEVRRRRKSATEKKTEPEKETAGEKSIEPPADEEPTVELDRQTVKMELVPLKMGTGRKPDPTAAFMLGMTSSQQFEVVANSAKNRHADAFRKAVQKEPKYAMERPFLAVLELGSASYPFALDAVGKNPKGYNTLYFDANRNGDLTDDKPIEAANVQGNAQAGTSQSQFSDIVVPMEIDSTTFDYRLCMVAGTRKAKIVNPGTGQPQSLEISKVQIKSAAIREGKIQQGTKSVRIVLVDQNSNGRFDDRVSIQRSGSRLRVTQGDLLLINPSVKSRSSGSTADRGRNLVNRTVCIGKRFYKMDVTPSGDRLTLEPAELTLGNVTSSNPGYRATVYSNEYGVVIIEGRQGQKIPLPTGEWKVANYTLIAPGARPSTASAIFMDDARPVTVEKDKTVDLKFGQPFQAEVHAYPDKKKGTLSLRLSVIGTGGEQCTSLIVNGKRPPEPLFEIRDKKGDLVHQGKFEWG